MEENQNQQTLKSKKKRKYLKLGGITILVLFSLQLVFYFGSDFLLRNFLKEKVNVASGNKYEIDFEEFHILFLQRGITFKGLKLNPVENQFQDLGNTPYYRISIPDIHITGLNYRFFRKEFVIGSIELVNPDVDFKLVLKDTIEVSKPDISPILILQEEIKKSFLGSQVKEIRINKLKIDEADLLLKNFISQKAIKAENTRLLLEDIQLLQQRNPETPFNAKGFSFGFDNFEVLLADSIHTIQAETVNVSSLKQFIDAKKVKIIPDFSKPANTYFQLDLEELLLKDADINRVFYTSEVTVGELKIENPEFNLYTKEVLKKDRGTEPFDLYDLVEGFLESIQIHDFEIEEGKFGKRLADSKDTYMIKTDRIDFKMEDFYIGSDESKKKNQFFYADNASVEIHMVEFALNDSIHRLKGDFVRLSSFDDKIEIDGFKLYPIEGLELDGQKAHLDIDVSGLVITEANLKKVYNLGIVDLKEVILDEPEILLKNIQGGKEKESKLDIKEIYSEYLNGIYVERFEIRQGSLILDNRVRIRQDSLSFGRINLVLENFELDDKTENADSKEVFLAENLQLEIKDYALKLADNLHIFKADRIFLDTKKYLIEIDGFAIRPLYKAQIQQTLDRYGKSTTLDIYVPKFMAKGVNIPKAYFDGILRINEILVPSPDISLYRYKQKIEDGTENELKRGEISELLTNYFSEIQVDSINVKNAKLNYQNFIADKTRSFTEENVTVSVKNFFINEATVTDRINSFFSEELDLNLSNYVFNIGNGKYTIQADGINFNTSREEIITRNVKLSPNRNFSDKTKVTATIPILSFRGVDLEAFLFDNTLSLQKVGLMGSSVELLIDKDWQEGGSQGTLKKARKDRTLPKNIGNVAIDTIETIDAKFSLGFKEQGTQRELINTQINLNVFDFLLDSANIQKGEIAGFFDGITLELDEFWLTLNDSVHQVTFSKVELDTKYDGVLVNNFRVIPRSLGGKPGLPVFSGHIPTILIKVNSLIEMQASKDLWLKQLRLYRPDLEVFLDEVKIPKKEKQHKESNREWFEFFQVDDFEIVEGNFSIFDKDGSKKPQLFNGVNFEVFGTKIDLKNLDKLDRNALLNQEFKFSIPNYEILMKDSLNKVAIGLISINNHEIRVSDLNYSPRFGRYQYGRILGKQTDVMNIHVPLLVLDKPDYDRFLEHEVLAAKSLKVSDIDAVMFRDKRYPRETGVYRPMPQELMRNSGIELRLDTFVIQNATIRYSEFFEKGMVPGELLFTDINAGLYPFHLSKSENPYPLVESFLIATTKLNGVADLNLQGHLFFQDPYPMRINAQLGEFDMRTLNSILETNAFVNIKRGTVNGADWSFVADNDKAVGQMAFLYSDLHVILLDHRTLEHAKGRDAILTFVLNSFALRANNPRRYLRNPIEGKIYQERDKEKFIFNYWWKTTFSGLKGSLGLGQAAPVKPKKDPKNKKKDEGIKEEE
ncbi:hypothetical protein MMU07_03000 [Aquiflexum sp. LQ15W]|uniref:hypothetical protein n=1 Tax=Cognataquiflexum nitidum TaxID=2922272 RepID=UPI001F138109|nr:hypothetical protein [Cognataquiflexum nitidum]MCH6198532.1 hypothetical protein [Cognataquiflexum nitidum]